MAEKSETGEFKEWHFIVIVGSIVCCLVEGIVFATIGLLNLCEFLIDKIL